MTTENGRHRWQQPLLRLVSNRQKSRPPDFWEQVYNEADASTRRFFARLPPLDVAGKRALDMGCGLGNTSFFLAEMGASEVLGVDIQDVGYARRKRSSDYLHLADRVHFGQITEGSGVPDE